jgi:hypothetical protein
VTELLEVASGMGLPIAKQLTSVQLLGLVSAGLAWRRMRRSFFSSKVAEASASAFLAPSTT